MYPKEFINIPQPFQYNITKNRADRRKKILQLTSGYRKCNYVCI